MVSFNCLSKVIMSGAICLPFVFSACNDKDKPVVSGPVRVNVEVVGRSDSTAATRQYSGTVEASDESVLSFSIPGTITKIYVAEGQKVSKGQLIAKIKSYNLVNSRNIAQAELEEAKDAYQRLKKLHDADALPEIKWVEVQAKLKQAENAAQLADRAVGDASIYSPINGYVSQKNASDGQTVVPAEPIVKVVGLNSLQVAISVPENEIASFGNGTKASVTFNVADSLEVVAKIANKGVVANPLTRSYTVKFDIENVDTKILPGMIANVNVEHSETDSVASQDIILPSQSVLLSSDNSQFVWIIKNGKAQRKDVVANELSAEGVIIKSGLAPGDSVIVAGMQKVGTGTSVAGI